MELFFSTLKQITDAVWLGLPSQWELQIPPQAKSFKTERDKHFSRLSPIVGALPYRTIRVKPS